MNGRGLGDGIGAGAGADGTGLILVFCFYMYFWPLVLWDGWDLRLLLICLLFEASERYVSNSISL